MATTKKVARPVNTSNVDAMNRKYGSVQLPEGYAPVAAFGTKWDYLNQPVLIGTIDGAGVRYIETYDKKTKELRLTQAVTVIEADSGAMIDVWESASLKEWFSRVIPGAEVALVFQGLREPKPGQSAMKVFVGSFKGEAPPPREDADEAPAPSKVRKSPKAAAAPAKKAARRPRGSAF